MRPTVFVCLLAFILVVGVPESLCGMTAGLGITGLGLTKPDRGDTSSSALSDVEGELQLSKYYSVGAAYSRFSVAYDDDHGNTSVDQFILSACLSLMFLSDGPLVTYLKLGGGYYTGEIAGSSTSRGGCTPGLVNGFTSHGKQTSRSRSSIISQDLGPAESIPRQGTS
jgi:hypothetical protein